MFLDFLFEVLEGIIQDFPPQGLFILGIVFILIGDKSCLLKICGWLLVIICGLVILLS